jgi:hypothetical protein
VQKLQLAHAKNAFLRAFRGYLPRCLSGQEDRKMQLSVRKIASVFVLSSAAFAVAHAESSFIGPMHVIKAHASTVPANGDVNPYGVAVSQVSTGLLQNNHILVSNFNNAANLQGTGTTIVQVPPGDGTAKLFAQIDPASLPGPCPGGVGLTTALVVLRSGWVIVGSLPTQDGTLNTSGPGCLLVLNSNGQVVETIAGPDINGPWDMTALDEGTHALLFVTNVLNGTAAANGHVVTQGTVVRVTLSISSSGPPAVTSTTVIGSGFSQRSDPAALVIGPTGVGLAPWGTLYVADTLANRIAAIPNAATRTSSAGTGNTVTGGGALNNPLGLAIAPNGHIVTTNGGDGNMVETGPSGVQLAVKAADITGTGGGTLFGLAVSPDHAAIYFVNDGNNTLDILH